MSEIRNAAWSMINWANVSSIVRKNTTIAPNHATIDQAIRQIEKQYDGNQLLLMEAEDLENLLTETIIDLLYKRHGKEIKRNLAVREREQKARSQRRGNPNFDVKVVPFGNLDELKKMGVDLDPETLDKLSNNIMDQLFRKKKKKRDDDDEGDPDDEDPGASFYL
jgi:hypothetical protein